MQESEGPLETLSGSLPEATPLNSSQMTLTELAQLVASMVAESPKFGLMPARSLPLEALTFFMMTWRSADCLQLPQER